MKRLLRLAVLLALLLPALSVRAEIILHPLFSDNAVLQRGMPVPVWGRAEPGRKVTVSAAGVKPEAEQKE